MNKLHYLFSLFIALLLSQCIPPTEEIITDINIDFKDKTLQQLYTFQDRQATDSLFKFLRHKDPTYRYMGAMAFGSIKDPRALDSLEVLLNDPIDDVKTAAAYALGQIGETASEDKLVAAFNQLDTAGMQKKSNATILEAIGKSASEKFLNPLSSVSTYQPTDTLLLEGQAWSIYRFALRGIVSKESTERMVALATTKEYPTSVRMIAANYLYRATNINLDEYDKIIADAIAKEDDPRIRMTLAIALGKTATEAASTALIYQMNIERDPRVKCNILRALANFDYNIVEPVTVNALKDENPQVALTAAQYFVNNGAPTSAGAYWRMAKDPEIIWQAQILLYNAALKHMPVFFTENRKYINWELKRKFETSPNSYEKAAIVNALAEDGWNYLWIKRFAFPSEFPVVRTASIEGLAKICRNKDFDKIFGLGKKRVKKELSQYFAEAIEIRDPGMAAVAANVLRDKNLRLKGQLDSLNFLEDALKQFDLPREIETYNEVQKTLNFFNTGEEGEGLTPEFNHPVDWITFNEISNDQKVTLVTNKGNIVIDLLPETAPGTVTNFIRLIKNGFYKNKAFHRVVPNFVIQTGCPRGDGYGSLDYTIRSELPLMHYDDGGYVGMASAGNNTECTQFFITHSPTPHLDGNYTIFGKVSEGMDIVQNIMVGDLITDVTISSN